MLHDLIIEELSRRQFVEAAGTVSILALMGCTDESGENSKNPSLNNMRYATTFDDIQPKLDELAAADGGRLILGPAPISDPFRVPPGFEGFNIPPHVSICGQGPRGTVFELQGNLPGPLFDASGTTTEQLFTNELLSFGIRGEDYSGTAIDLSYNSLVTLFNISIRDINGIALNLVESWDIDIIGLLMDHCGDATTEIPSIRIAGAVDDDIQIGNNIRFSLCQLEADYYTTVSIEAYTKNTVFTNCKIHPAGNHTHPAISIEEGAASTIINATHFDNTVNGISVSTGVESVTISSCIFAGPNARTYIEVAGGNGITIANNTFGIYRHSGVSGRHNGIRLLGGNGRVISNVYNGHQYGSNGIEVNGNWTIANNEFSQAGMNGISVNSGTNRIMGNVCYNNSQVNAGGYYGIDLSGATETIVVGNRCYDDQVTQTQGYGINDDGDRNSFVANILLDNLNGGFSGNAGTNSEKVANIQ